ncbi:sensor histidine kinase [Vibrio coralliilyticus ATCC BAA-450]|nr:sensor histidine kinase [Vibrio coralliilyticus ATCC BAA-450]MCM5508318.1 GGDEF domain-containing protein [Vibrio sp. SCSIO 43169]MDE3897024.1 GGDEF domain-containing protein [Vibrio sp. CC007]NRF14728.1 GGDEF domain-containing protein [Vibrio coralliilyticus]QFT38269.1 Diguanylate cyclase DosC [Vibrio sp. THAF64]QGM37193.1 Diguanylate cyclase DosC [Vibrio sp. THAF191d]QGN72534.1 Diguanylate cyclase DosC [Vibrio sp. THAF191c]
MGIHLDITTLSIICVLLSLCYCIGLLLIQQLQPSVSGISTIASALLLLSVSFFLLSFGNQITHWVSKILANSLMAFSYIILLLGVCQFRRFPRIIANIGFYSFPILIVGLTYFTFFMPSTNARVILMTVYVSSLCFIAILANQKGKSTDITPSKFLLSLGLATQGGYNLFRFIWTLFEERIDDFMISGMAHQLAFVSTLLMVIFIGFSVTWMLTGRLVATIYDTSIKDELTQLYNRRALEELLPKEIARSSRHKQPLSVLLLDIDHFKKVNDTYGHQAGDRVLRTTGKLLILQTRKDDLSFRYGGEEFLVLLPNTDVEKAVIVAEKLREAIKRARMLPTNVDSCTASFGVTQFNGEDDWQTAIERADQALYSAKENGRNQVTART